MTEAADNVTPETDKESTHSGTETIVYPEDLRDETNPKPYMQITIHERHGEDKSGFTTNLYTYIPAGVFNNDGISYGTLERGMTGQIIESLKGTDRSKLTAEDIEAAFSRVAGEVGGAIGFDITGGYNAAVAERGVAVNPSAVITLDSSEVRQFDMTLKFIAESKKESEQVSKIIRRIQEFMYPEQIGKFALQYPALFEVKFMVPVGGTYIESPFMPLYEKAYCTGMQTTYNSGHSSFHADGSPVEIDCQLSFREHRNLTREDIKARMALVGVDDLGSLYDELGATNAEEAEDRYKTLLGEYTSFTGNKGEGDGE